MAGPERQMSDFPTNDGAYAHRNPVVDQALEWQALFQSGGAGPEQVAALERWLAEDPGHAQAFARVNDMLGASEMWEATRRAAKAAAPRAPKAARPPRFRIAAYAAAAALLVIVGSQAFPRLSLWWSADYVTRTAERRTIDLPDGSQMTLNAASAAALDFKDGRRGVRLLEGDAYFEVTPDAAHPFHVTGRFSETEVKGTAFVVSANEDEDVVALDHGRVEVKPLSGAAAVAEIFPGEGVTARSGSLSAVAPVDVDEVFGWRTGRIVFYDRPFAKAVDAIRRYYDGTILILDAQARSTRVSGSYRSDDPEGALRSLAEVAGLSVNRLPGGVMVFR
jgi:transmembrane sensor